MSRWAVIGANSFSGAAFCRRLEEAKEEVFAFTRGTLSLHWPRECMIDALLPLDPHYVVNFAALNMVAESWKHYEDYYRVNVVGVANLARACQTLLSFQKFVQVSTPEVYGNVEHTIDESQPFNPSTPYAVSRAAADMDLLALHRATGFPVCFTRTVNVYGESQQRYRIIPKTILKILRGEKLFLEGGGKSIRSFIHIDDVARGIQFAAIGGVPGETYHMAHPSNFNIEELVKVICYEMGVNFHDCVQMTSERMGKDAAYFLDYAKIRRNLLWTPTIDLRKRLPDIVRWFRENSHREQSLEYEHRP